MNRLQIRFWSALVCCLSLAGLVRPVAANTLCVNPAGSGGCYKSIQTAVNNASSGDIIQVAKGTYHEAVVIGTSSISLIGAGAGASIIDATGQGVAVHVDGMDNPGLHKVIVADFTVENGNFEGILVTNASDVTIRDNQVQFNDKALVISVPVCPGQPPFETGEAFDCGEGIHLSGANHSVVANNDVENNAGGILLSDDTGETSDNLITGNVVANNPFDCGIVMASHAPAPGSSAPHLGIVHNTVSGNKSTHNGFQVPGAGAGVGIFSDGSGVGLVSGNVIIENELTDNGLPGVAFHSHVGPNFGLPADNLNDNLIIGNHISGNGADLFDTATPGTAGINISSGAGGSPITGTLVSGNVISDEDDDIVMATPGYANVHLNDLLRKGVGIDNLANGTVDATDNWWGCPAGPGGPGCSSVEGAGISWVPWLDHPVVPVGKK
ncbi:MAG: right-handed parallel beta-helix repeat-containing protein [Candidatus Acidiferrum sp.]|jgi:parallel beta-helix repeat protein